MEIIAAFLVTFVGCEHLAIMLIEMFASPQKQAEYFDLSVDYTKQRPARIAMANQGIYNGMLGFLILVSYWLLPRTYHLVVTQLLMIFVVVVALYGGFTVSRKVWSMQMLPAVLARAAVGFCIL